MLNEDNRKFVDVTVNKTLAAADQGIVQNVTVDGVVITLPAAGAAALGLRFTIRNGGDNPANTAAGAVADGSALVTVTTSATDTVAGNGYTPAANKGPVNTKTTSKVGDEVTLTSGVSSYNQVETKGIWARAA